MVSPEDTEGADGRSRRGASWLPWLVLAIVVLLVLWLLRGYAFGPDVEPGSATTKTTTINVTDIAKPPSTTPEVPDASAETTEVSRVPDVVGLFEDGARGTLERSGFKMSATRVYSTSEPVDMVFEQVPSAFEEAPPGSVVTVLVSSGPSPVGTVSVPDVVGLKIETAKARIEARGLEYRLMVQPRRDSAGRIYEQSPDAGTEALEGSKVFILGGESAGD